MPDRGICRAYVGLGANLGDARASLDAARRSLAGLRDTREATASGLYRSAPVQAGGPDYLNAVLALDTGLHPHELLDAMQAIEQTHGRTRERRHAPRTLDLDLLLHGDTVCRDARLTLPHPRLHLRAFVLRPLQEIAPGLMLPGLGPLADWVTRSGGQAIERLGDW